MKLEPFTCTSADGTAIGALRVGTGPALLMVHGITADASRWELVLGDLAERFTVYAMDRRGRGASGDAESYALARESEDVAALAEAISDDVHLFGHSFGGLVALEAACIAPRVKTLTVYEPYVPEVAAAEPSPITRAYEELTARGERAAVVVKFLREIVLAREAEIRALEKHPSWSARLATAHTIPREMRAAESYVFDAARFEDLAMRTRLLVGSETAPFLKDSVARLHAKLPGSTLVVLEGQGHIAMNTAPRAFVETVSAVA